MKPDLKGNADADLGYAVLVPDPHYLKSGWFRDFIGILVFGVMVFEGLVEGARHAGASDLPGPIYIFLGNVAFNLVCLWFVRGILRKHHVARSTREVIFYAPWPIGSRILNLAESGPLLVSKTRSGKHWAVRSSRGKKNLVRMAAGLYPTLDEFMLRPLPESGVVVYSA